MSEDSEYLTDSELSSVGGDKELKKSKADKEKSKKKKKHAKKDDKKDKKSKDKKSKSSSRKTKHAVVIDPELEDGLTDLYPKNPDGTLWKNPLKCWTNKPKRLNEPGDKMIMFPHPETDLFCRTADGMADNAHFYWHKVTGDFNCLVKIKGPFSSNYGKAGILLQQDERQWVLSGLENYEGRLCLSTSITRRISDWSLAPMGEEQSQKVRDEGVWVAVKRQEGRVACYYSFDLDTWIQTRMGEFEVEDTIKVGIACACPGGDPFKVIFEKFRIQGMAMPKK